MRRGDVSEALRQPPPMAGSVTQQHDTAICGGGVMHRHRRTAGRVQARPGRRGPAEFRPPVGCGRSRRGQRIALMIFCLNRPQHSCQFGRSRRGLSCSSLPAGRFLVYAWRTAPCVFIHSVSSSIQCLHPCSHGVFIRAVSLSVQCRIHAVSASMQAQEAVQTVVGGRGASASCPRDDPAGRAGPAGECRVCMSDRWARTGRAFVCRVDTEGAT